MKLTEIRALPQSVASKKTIPSSAAQLFLGQGYQGAMAMDCSRRPYAARMLQAGCSQAGTKLSVQA